MRPTLLLVIALFLGGCESKDAKYKNAVQPLYDSLVKVRDDIKDGVIGPSFLADCEAAEALLGKAHGSLSNDDQGRPSFVNMEGSFESYWFLTSVRNWPADVVNREASGASGDLDKARAALDANN
jgi:hypothetical protein